MNEYTEIIFSHILEECNQVVATTEYQLAKQSYDREENALLAMLTPEQIKQFDRCNDSKGRLENINLECMFQQTLKFMRGLFCC